MKISLRTLNGSSCRSFPKKGETSVKEYAFSDVAILRDCFPLLLHDLHEEVIQEETADCPSHIGYGLREQ